MQEPTSNETDLESSELKDSQLYRFFTETDPEVLKNLTPSVSKSDQEEFLNSDFSSNPLITYSNLNEDSQELNKKRATFIEKAPFLVQAFIDSRDLNTNDKEDLISYYQTLLNERLTKFDLLLASQNHEWEKFNQITEKTYGTPSPEIFNTYLRNINKEITKETESPQLAETQNTLKAILPKISGSILNDKNIDLEPIKQYLDPLMQPIINTLEQYPDTTLLGSTIIRDVFTQALKSINADDLSVEISNEYKSITVKNNTKKIYIPQEREVSKDELLGLVAHEIFTHVQRRKLSEKIFPYEILIVGLDGYLESEEAIATFSEAAYNTNKKITLDGGDLHFGTCLALGLDGRKRDFKDVFQILYLIKKMENLQNGKEYKIAEEKAKDSAWKTTLRVFRGTPGNIPGCCFRKDIVYGEGRLQLIEYLETYGDMDIADLWKAKYTPWNPEHLEIMEKYQ